MGSPEDPPADQPGSGKRRKASEAASSEGLDGSIVVTLNAGTGSIVKIEIVGSDGSRHELSAKEAAGFLAEHPKSTLEDVVQEAFEAGIACVLDEVSDVSAADEGAGESREDALLHEILLGALIQRTAAKRLLSRDVLNRAMLSTIISEAPETEAPPPT